jgi:hypothetical protein
VQWLATNWFWVLIGVLFVGMHLVGHGGHGGHGADAGLGVDLPPERSDVTEGAETPGRRTTGNTRGHQH